MADDEILGHAHDRLRFDSPLSSARADGLIEQLQLRAGACVADLGCGWAELLLRAVERTGGLRGEGVDTSAVALERARRNALERGLAARVELEEGDAGAWTRRIGQYDAVICIGSSHALGGTEETLAATRRMLRGPGRLLIGEGFWAVPPTPEALAGLGATEDELTNLPGLLARAEAAGLRAEAVEVASQEEWDEFESLWCAGLERWADANPDDPGAARAREVADDHRGRYERGYRGVLGFAYLVLSPA